MFSSIVHISSNYLELDFPNYRQRLIKVKIKKREVTFQSFMHLWKFEKISKKVLVKKKACDYKLQYF